MILVLGSVLVADGQLERATALSQEHVRRSRTEPGCVSHDLHHDATNPLRLVFVERWVNHAALMRHFAVPESGVFVRDLTNMSSEAPRIEIFDATPVDQPLADPS